MKYERFEDLPVWKAAIELAEKVYALTAHQQFKGNGSLRDQIERAAVSVSNNIAEGFERATTQELLTFIYIARGSAGEVRSMLSLLERLNAFQDLKSEISKFEIARAKRFAPASRLGQLVAEFRDQGATLPDRQCASKLAGSARTRRIPRRAKKNAGRSHRQTASRR